MNDVRIVHDNRGHICGIEFRDPLSFDWESGRGELTIWFEDESGMDWHRLRTVVEQEAAAEDADMVTEYTKGAAA